MNESDDDGRTRHRWVRWMIGIGLVPAAVIAFFLIENYRGEKAWAAAQAKMEAAGLSLNFAEFLAPPLDVSDEENMAAAEPYSRAVSEIEFYSSSSLSLPSLSLSINRAPNMGQVATEFVERRVILPVDNEAPAETVLRALAGLPHVRQLDAALARPHASFTVEWHSGMYPIQGQRWYSVGHREILILRACARIALGRSAEALEDLRLLHKLEEVTFTPTAMALVYDHFTPAAEVAWYGLASNVWDAEQRQEIDALFANVSPAGMTLKAVAGQNAHFHATMSRYLSNRSTACRDFALVREWEARRSPYASMHEPTLMDWLVAHSPNAVPGGWFRQDQAAVAAEVVELFRELKACTEPAGHFRPTPLTSEAGGSPATAIKTLVLPEGSTPAWREIIDGQRRLAANIAMMRAAIALMDHRETAGALPGALDELKVRLAPDPITGQPLHYEKVDEVGFKLWSVGLDGADDGGVELKGATDGDWVWQSWVN